MARTSEQLTPQEILSVEDLANLPANSVVYKDSSGNFSSVALGASGTVLQSNGAASAPTFETPSAGGSSLWTSVAGTRTGNTTFTVTGDQTSTFSRGLVIKWTESSVQKLGFAVSSSFSSVTTVIIAGDTMASIDASSLKYTSTQLKEIKGVVSGNVTTVKTDVGNAFYAHCPLRILGCDLDAGTAGTTNSTTIDVNKNGTTMFTTKPTLASGVASSATPFTADSGTSLAIWDRVSFDIDAVQTTPATDLYITVYAFPSLVLNLS